MKLYATIASERASKSQGGNDYIDFKLNAGSADDSREVFTVRAKLEGDNIEIGIWKGAKEQTQFFTIPFPTIDEDTARRIQSFGEQHPRFHSPEMKQWRKGEKKKDETA